MVFALVVSFTVLIIFIASLGLLGLTAFMTVKRTRETGIRRVMGASQNQILLLFLTCSIFCHEKLAAEFYLSH